MARKRSTVEIFKDILSQNLLPLERSNPLPRPAPSPKVDFAQYLLAHSQGGPKSLGADLAGRAGAETEEPSLLSKIFDVASAPLYGMYSAVEEQAENIGDFVEDPSLGTFKDFFTAQPKAVAGAAAQAMSSGNDLPGGGLANFLGKVPEVQEFADENAPKQLGSDILGDLGVKNKFAKYGGGFALDVLADPLTYVPVAGFARTGQKAAKTAKEALEEAAAYGKSAENFIKPDALSEFKTADEAYTTFAPPKPQIETPPVAEMAMRGGTVPQQSPIPQIPRQSVAPPQATDDFSWGLGDNILRANANIPSDPDDMIEMLKLRRSDNAKRAAEVRHGRDPNLLDVRDMDAFDKADFADRFRQAKMAKARKVTDGKGNVSNKAIASVLESIRNGDLPKVGPIPNSATGLPRDTAIDVADSFITKNLMPATGKKHIDLNPGNQVKLYHKLYASTAGLVNDTSPESILYRKEQALKMLRSAEDHMIRLGKRPVFWNGMGVRLSDVVETISHHADIDVDDVINAFATKNLEDLDNPMVKEAIEIALGRRSMVNADLLEDFTKLAASEKARIMEKWNQPVAKVRLEEMKQQALEAARMSGMTMAEAKAVEDIVRNVIDVDKLEPERYVESLSEQLLKAQDDKRLSAEILNEINKKIIKSIGQSPKKLADDVTGSTAIDGFMVRMSTAWGRGEMKRFAQDVFTWGELNAIWRSRWLAQHVKGHTPGEIQAAFRYAQGVLPEVSSEKERLLGEKFLDYFQTMLDSSGFAKMSDASGTVANKSLIHMADVNKHLKAVGSTFEFISSKKAVNKFGTPRDYSPSGEGWMKSWENADPSGHKQDPISFMYDLDLAIERTVKENTMYDEFGMRFGAKKTDPHYDPKIHTTGFLHPRLDGYYFPKTHTDAMKRLVHDMEEGIWTPRNNKVLQYYSRALRAWKTGVTIYLPSHHIRNMIGDVHLMWWAGHNDPRDFIRARRIMHSQRGKYAEALKQDTLQGVSALVSKDAMDAAQWASTQGKDIILKRNGVQISADEIYIAAHQHGLLLDANKYEDIFGVAPLEGLSSSRIRKPLGGVAHHAAAMTAEYREHYVRIAHFVAAVNKGLKKSKDLGKIYEEAAHEVRKWHPDGHDLTTFEQKIRMMIPFYSWTRKALPLIVQSAVTRPAKVLYFPRANVALQGMLGVEGATMADPFPENQLFPEWIRAKGIGPIGDPESDNIVSAWWGKLGNNSIGLDGQQTGYTIVNPSNPFIDVVEQLAGFGGSPQEIFGSTFDSATPAIKIPGEIWKDESFSGAPISKDEGGQGFVKYFGEQVPIVSPMLNIVEPFKEDRVAVENGYDRQALINYLTAIGLRGTGPYQKSGEFEAKERASRQS